MDVQTLKQFLNVNWLRPESAIWDAVAANVMKDWVFESPSLDFGSGDGVYSFIAAGGSLDKCYDFYYDVSFTESFFNNVDVYNHYANDARFAVIKNPDFKIDFALDHKESLLAKARRLNFYNNFIIHDANKSLPFEAGIFKTIFTNILYWLTDVESVLKELNRILQSGGGVAVMFPDKKFLECSFYNKLYLKTGDSMYKWLELIDRGNFFQFKYVRDYNEWECMFEKAGFVVDVHRKYLSTNFIKMWNIGLRPLFPVLHKTISKLNDVDRQEIKDDFVNLLYKFVKPLMDIDLSVNEEDCVFHYCVLRKVKSVIS